MSDGGGLTIGALTLADLAPLFEDPPEAPRARLQWPHSPFAFWLARTRPTWRIAGTGAAFDEVCAVIVEANLPYERVSPASPAADLLVLDGSSQDEAIDPDEGPGFGRWQPLLAPDAMVLIHGIHGGCGGSRLWQQWRRDHPVSPVFTLSAGRGLGLGIMDETSAPPRVLELCALSADAAAFFQQVCASAAARWEAASREAESQQRVAWRERSYLRSAERQKEGLQCAIREVAAEREVMDAERSSREAVLTAERARAEGLEQRVAAMEAVLTAEPARVEAVLTAERARVDAVLTAERATMEAVLTAERARMEAALSAERARADGLAQRVAAMEATNTWRAGTALQRIPGPARTFLRRVGQVIWWTVTGQLVRRLRARRASLRAARQPASNSGTGR